MATYSIRNFRSCIPLVAVVILLSFVSSSCSSHSAKVGEVTKTGNLAATENPLRNEPLEEEKSTSESGKTLAGGSVEMRAITPSMKIGVIDLQRVAEESGAGKNSTFEYNLLAKSKQTQINEKTQAIEELRRELEEQRPNLSEEAMQQKLGELEALESGLSHFAQDAEAELGRRYEALYSSMLKDVSELAAQIGESEDYTIILDRGSVLYCDRNLDITDLFIKRYDAFRESKRTSPGESTGK